MTKHGTSRGTQRHQGGDANSLGPLALMMVHLLGVMAVAAGIAAFILPGAHAGVLWTVALESGEVGRSLMVSGSIHLVLSTLLWFGAAAVVETVWRRRHRLRPQRRAIERQRGSVYVEFLAVLPVFLLLTFGLLQLTIINIGGALARVAAYEGARAVWLWQPESLDRTSVDPKADMDEVANRARIAAALVMTPVAPGDYRMDDPADMAGDEHDAFVELRDAMTVRFDENVLGTSTTLSAPTVELDLDSRQATLVSAFDGSNMEERAVRKFTFSYLTTEIDPGTDIIVEGGDPCDGDSWSADDGTASSDPSRLGLHFSHYQHMAMPFVDRIFGKEAPAGTDFAGRGGQYYEWDMKFTFPAQRHCPNRELP